MPVPAPASSGIRRPNRSQSWRPLLAFCVFSAVWWVLSGGFLMPFPSAAAADAGAAASLVTESPEHREGAPSAAESGGAEHDGGQDAGHKDPVAEVLLAISVILLLARLAGDLFDRIGMPAVLGELTVGIVLGNWALLTGSAALEFFKPDSGDPHAMTGNVLEMLSSIGVVLLLFEVGLESRVREMMSVGLSSFLVAVIGVIAPMGLGAAIGFLLVAESWSEWQIPAFLGATLCATSVGITARVLKDLGHSRTRESRIILGAAVIDDVLGLIVLAVVSGVIREGDQFEMSSLVQIVGVSFAFLATALILGALQLPRHLFRLASFLRGRGLLVSTALVICFLFSWAANYVAHLAPIIGAFSAGLILEGAHYQEAGDKWKNRHLEDALAPLTTLLVPIFFVATGIAVDLSKFSGTDTWLLAAGLTVVAIIGKQACSWGVVESGVNRRAVGLGMVPRGEVGLIFAAAGRSLTTPSGESVIDDATFSAIVVMVMITTMITPPLLKWSLGPAQPDDPAPEPSVETAGTADES